MVLGGCRSFLLLVTTSKIVLSMAFLLCFRSTKTKTGGLSFRSTKTKTGGLSFRSTKTKTLT